jgi:hypothetical protein
VVVDDFRVERFAVLPHKAHAPLLIDADAVLTFAIALERLELITRRTAKSPRVAAASRYLSFSRARC